MIPPRLLLLAALALLASPALPQVSRHLWVDAVQGKDSNPGTASLPFRSITKGVAVGQQDVVIHVNPGTYSPSKTGEVFTIQFSGVYKNVTLTGVNAKACIIDFEQVVASMSSWYFLISTGAQGIEIAHLTMKNGAFRPTVPWYSAAIWWQSVKGLDLHHCIIEACESGIYSANAAQDVAVHDNVFLGCNIAARFRQDATAGAKNCRFYNNLVANSTAGFVDTVSPSANDATQVFVNNLSINNQGNGFQGTLPAGIVFENNNAWNNTGSNYSMTGPLSKTNTSKDPMLVDLAKGDYHLKPGSPMIEAGYAGGQPGMVNDFFGNARVSDHDGDQRSLPDIGIHEVAGISLAVANWGQGKTAKFTTTPNQANMGSGFLFVSPNRRSTVLSRYGSIGLDPLLLFFVGTSKIPGSVSLSVPKNPVWVGVTLYFQALAFNGTAWRPSGCLDLGL